MDFENVKQKGQKSVLFLKEFELNFGFIAEAIEGERCVCIDNLQWGNVDLLRIPLKVV